MIDFSPTLSIVTICLNAEVTIQETLKSVTSQSGIPSNFIEHIIVDGKSSDKTLGIVNFYAKNAGYKVAIFSECDSGISDAFNKGVTYSRGKYIIFLNADDVFLDDKVLFDFQRYIEKYDMPEWIVGDVDVLTEEGEVISQPRRFPPFGWSLIFRNRICHQAVFLKRETITTVGSFDCSYKIAMDYDLWARLYLQRFRPKYFKRVIVKFALGGVSSNYGLAEKEMKLVKKKIRTRALERFIGSIYDFVKEK